METEAVSQLPDELAEEVRVQRTVQLLRMFPIFEGVSAAYLREHRIFAEREYFGAAELSAAASAASGTALPSMCCAACQYTSLSYRGLRALEARSARRAVEKIQMRCAGVFLVESGTVGATTAEGDRTAE
jgi:hypothetical protein